MKYFSVNLNGDRVEVGNIKFRLIEDLVAWACGVPQEGENWFKNQWFNKDKYTPFLRKEHVDQEWSEGILQDYLKSKYW